MTGKRMFSCVWMAALLELASGSVGRMAAVIVVIGKTIAFIDVSVVRNEAVSVECGSLSLDIPAVDGGCAVALA